MCRRGCRRCGRSRARSPSARAAASTASRQASPSCSACADRATSAPSARITATPASRGGSAPTSVGARFRAGSNFPITGYWAEQGGAYFVGTDRNTLRVPTYARLDVRANRTFTWERKRLTLFAEGINLLNRPNVRFSLPAVNRRTFEATGLLDTMVPLIPSVGILLEF